MQSVSSWVLGIALGPGLALLGAGVSGCGDDADGGERDAGARQVERDAANPVDAASEADAVTRWVGAVPDSDIRLGAVLEGRRARLFFCGGPSSYATATRWLIAAIDADGEMHAEESGFSVHARLERGALEGEFGVPDQASRPFSAAAIREGTLAGLYEGQAECGRLGLIVTQPTRNAEAEGQGACVGSGHPPEQVNPILPIALDGDEIAVEIGGVQARVHEAAPPM